MLSTPKQPFVCTCFLDTERGPQGGIRKYSHSPCMDTLLCYGSSPGIRNTCKATNYSIMCNLQDVTMLLYHVFGAHKTPASRNMESYSPNINLFTLPRTKQPTLLRHGSTTHLVCVLQFVFKSLLPSSLLILQTFLRHKVGTGR